MPPPAVLPTQQPPPDLSELAAAMAAENAAAQQRLSTAGSVPPPPAALAPEPAEVPPAVASAAPEQSPARGAAAPSLGSPAAAARRSRAAALQEAREGVLSVLRSQTLELDPAARAALGKALDGLEAMEQAGADVAALLGTLSSETLRSSGGGAVAAAAETPSSAAPAAAAPASTSPAPAAAGELVIRILSSWNGGADVGLTAIELLDARGHRLPLRPHHLTLEHHGDKRQGLVGGGGLRGFFSSLFGGGGGGRAGAQQEVSRLVDGECRTTDPNRMFLTRIPPGGRSRFRRGPSHGWGAGAHPRCLLRWHPFRL